MAVRRVVACLASVASSQDVYVASAPDVASSGVQAAPRLTVSADEPPAYLNATAGDVEAWRHFAAFAARFGRQFVDEAERALRFEAFKANWRTVEEHNAQDGNSFTLAVNHLSDLTEDEWKARLNFQPLDRGLEAGSPDFEVHSYDPRVSLPESVDWTTTGAITPVKDQGQCGACWAFASTGALEAAAQIASGELVALSEQQFVDCTPFPSVGCEGGNMAYAFQYSRSHAICAAEDYRYTASTGGCAHRDGCSDGLPQGCQTGNGYVELQQANEDSLKSAVAQQPVAVAIAASSFEFQLYSSGIYDKSCGPELDHAVLVVGYGEEGGRKYWKIKNSWTATWGDHGYVKFLRDSSEQGTCGLYIQPTYPKMSQYCDPSGISVWHQVLIFVTKPWFIASAIFFCLFCGWGCSGLIKIRRARQALPDAQISLQQEWRPSAPPPPAGSRMVNGEIVRG